MCVGDAPAVMPLEIIQWAVSRVLNSRDYGGKEL